MLARIQWSPERFAAAVARIRDDMDLSAAELGRLAGISRSQASRWGRGAHQPAYGNVRQLGIAVYREHPELAQELMAGAGYPPITEADAADEPERLVPLDDWEAGVLSDPDLPDRIKRRFILDSRASRAAYDALRRSQREAGREAG